MNTIKKIRNESEQGESMSKTKDTVSHPTTLGEEMTHMEFEHVTFDLPHGTFHALQGGDPNGEPTLVLHGFPDHPPTAKPFLAELGRRGRHVVAPWLRGYAPSPTAGPFDMAALTGDVLARVLPDGAYTWVIEAHDEQGQTNQVTGPLTIANISGEAASQGASSVVFLIGILSINLGVLNLLPIPILDGGHLLFFLIEGILRKPLGERQRELAQQVGLVLLVGVMIFPFWNDLERIFSR